MQPNNPADIARKNDSMFGSRSGLVYSVNSMIQIFSQYGITGATVARDGIRPSQTAAFPTFAA